MSKLSTGTVCDISLINSVVNLHRNESKGQKVLIEESLVYRLIILVFVGMTGSVTAASIRAVTAQTETSTVLEAEPMDHT